MRTKSILIVASVCLSGAMTPLTGCKPRVRTAKNAGNSRAPEVHPLSSQRDESELRAVFNQVLARYKKTSVKSLRNDASTKSLFASLAAPRRQRTLNVRLRGPVAPPIRAAGGIVRKTMAVSNTLNVEFPEASDDTHLAAVMEFLRSDARIDLVEPDYVVRANVIPNDARFSELWGLQRASPDNPAGINAVDAWDRVTGSRDVVVGVIDTGIDCTHPDLSENCWVNQGESGPDAQGKDKRANGVDDDGNGYVDDWQGWNFIANSNQATDDNMHGTHVAGTIGASGNNTTGVTGINWRVSLVPLKFLAADGSGFVSDAIIALDYATRMGFFATNNSWGGGERSRLMEDAIARANEAGSLFIAAAGNFSNDNDKYPIYPANFVSPNLISVAAAHIDGTLAYFSNFGARTVTVAAPGVNILSTTPANTYNNLSGTSMAAPHVTGALALLKARYPGESGPAIKSRLLNSVASSAPVKGRVLTGGIINVAAALDTRPDTTPPPPPADIQVARRGSNAAALNWPVPADAGTFGGAKDYQIRISRNKILSQTEWDAATTVTFTTRMEGERYWADLTGLPVGFAGWVTLRARSWSGFVSDISAPVELRLLPMRVVDEYDGNSLANLPGETPWTIEDDPARGPERSKVFSDGPGPYPPNARRRLTLREIPLANVQHLAISWWSRAALETKWDTGNVLVSYQGKSGTVWHTVDSVTGLTDWQLRSVDVTHLAFRAVAQGADRVQVHFELSSDDTVEYEGWLIDDITVAVNDSLIKTTGIPVDVATSQPLAIDVVAPPGTLYTTSFIEGNEPVRVDCADDEVWANPAPQTPAGEPTRVVQNTRPGKFLCVRAQVPGYRGFVHSWAAWQVQPAEINVVASGHPTGVSNLNSFSLLVNAGSTGVATAFSTALTRPMPAADACSRPTLTWTSWMPTGRPVTIDVQAVLRANNDNKDGDIVLCVRGRDSAGDIQQKPLQLTWTRDTRALPVTFSGLPPAVSNAKAINLTVTADEPGTVRYLVQPGRACDIPALLGSPRRPLSDRITQNLPATDGPYTICGVLTDAIGNEQQTPATYTWQKDTVPPVAAFGKVPPKRTPLAVAEFTVRGSDLVDYQWVIPAGRSTCANATYSAFKPVASATSANAGSPGIKTICVRGRDAAGNIQTTPTSYQWTVIPRGGR